MDLNDAIAELRRVTPADDPWQGRDLGPYEAPELASPTDNAIATILNAVLSGQLIPLETCNARVVVMVEAAAGEAAGEVAAHGAAELAPFVRRRVRALTPADAQAALDAMISRARADGMREALNIANMNAWRHQGEDAHSKGMDAGARHQSQVIHDAITAALAEPPAAIRANAGEG